MGSVHIRLRGRPRSECGLTCPVIRRGETTRPRVAGFSLLEAVAAIAIVGFALVVAAHAMSAYAATVRRAEVRQQLLWAAENVIESVRGGQLPLTSGTVQLDRDLSPPDGEAVHLFLEVRQRDQPGLHDIAIRASTSLPGRREEVELSTMVWRP